MIRLSIEWTEVLAFFAGWVAVILVRAWIRNKDRKEQNNG